MSENKLSAVPSIVTATRIIEKRVSDMIDKPAGMGMMGRFRVKVLNKDGSIDRDYGYKPMHSFVRNFGLLVRGFLLNLDTVNESISDENGVLFKIRYKSETALTGASATDAVAGAAIMKFGQSSTALDSTQTDIIGAAVGSDATVTTTLTTEDTVETEFNCTAQTTNSSGGPLNVEEIGLFANLNDSAAVATLSMMIRELTGTVAVADTQTIQGDIDITLAV